MENWKSISLGNVCTIKKGEQLNKLELEDAGDYPCINGGISPSGYTDKWNTEENTITISEGGNSCGYINFIKTNFWSGGHCYSLLGIKNFLDRDFFYFALKGRENLIMDLRVGSGLPNIQQKAIKAFEFIYPKDKAEQSKIAEILSKVDKAISETEIIIAKYNRIKTGLMQDLLTKGIDEKGNSRSEETHDFKDSPLGRIPKEWDCLTIDKVKDFLTSGSRGWAKYYSIEGSKFIRITNLKRNQIEIDLSDLKFVKLPSSIEGIRSRLQEGDLLISITADLGIIGVVSSSIGEAFVNQHISLVRLNQEVVDSKFVGYFLSSSYGQAIFNLLNDGGAKAGLNLKTINNLFVLKPQLDEQILIVEKIEKLNEAILKLKTENTKLKSIKTGLMQDLLSGKKRVTHLIN